MGEKIRIRVGAVEIWVTVVDIDRGKIRLGIDAPRDTVEIFRQELLPLDPPARDPGSGGES